MAEIALESAACLVILLSWFSFPWIFALINLVVLLLCIDLIAIDVKMEAHIPESFSCLFFRVECTFVFVQNR